MRLTETTTLVGDELGGVKGVFLEKEQVALQFRVTPDKDDKRFSARFIVPFGEAQCVAVGTSDGRVCQFAGLNETRLPPQKISDSLAGLEALSHQELIACSTNGLTHKINDEGAVTRLFDVGDNVCFMQLSSAEPVFAVGGKEHEVELWDLETQKSVFCAKNVKADNLCLRQPVHNRAGAFIPGSSPSIVCAGTAFGDLRIYDTRSGQRRPIKSFTTIQQKRNGRACEVTCVCVTHDGQNIVVGNSEGDLLTFDVGTAKLGGAYRGHAGAVSSTIFHKDDSVLLSCGADRFLHVHDYGSRREIAKVYLRNRLSGLMRVPDEWVEPDPKKDDEDFDDDQRWLEGADDEDENGVNGDVDVDGARYLADEQSRKDENKSKLRSKKRRKRT
eukprot:Plantae.Rhodophyta-Purpureofilum_apyrenoidigerum.ctg4214.p1 GENE.Plantae.Rhodophyta-Purpureofilum_apyrenoidigerum.ctg4214~~Plantae.Rhodophyta-Purpureofilum_apyrenoidigerum.ctg4214.p1  ORF type:complete len:387 (+),score=61.38 Plantae.Rhodophyta-Purpureofilum_apyrenoidigerum.ctg4214:174-1334(+)